MLPVGAAYAANPRWTTGWPYFQNDYGASVIWYTTQPQYFTDPGGLSAGVNHAAADALVASAAAVWNNSMSSIVLGQGGALNEHVSSGNVYIGSSGPVFPSDVQASNSLAKPIAIIYDTDGSVTDTLLGGGASDPGNCRQSAVTESVDSIASNGQIQHALIVLNGRCISSLAATQQEMKYRLVRAFGRVLGLGWSQLNDNVFTGVPQATQQQAQNWPVMHPIDILCGPYAYQCMVNPFTLRTDDLSSLISMYPVTTSGNGKTASYANATQAIGSISFANSQGMQGVLVSLRRFHFGPGYSDTADLISAVSGQQFEQIAGSPITPKGSSLANSFGSINPYFEGYYSIGWVPVPTTDYFDNFTVTTSTINPLYTGQYSVGPYAVSQVTPSGPPMTGTQNTVNNLYGSRIDLTANGSSTSSTAAAPESCSATSDGTESSPNMVPSSGFWSNAMCGYQHAAWSNLAVKAGRSLTMEVTAVDEQGYATTAKMLPVLGVWDSTDNSGTLPTLASQAVGLNASTLGMTDLIVSSATARTMRIVVADQRGDGRPDYAYNARVLYADSISPASLPANGGSVTISGMGFRPGNTVTINGLVANVTGWTSNTVTLVAPAITGPLSADVVVRDLSTGGQTTMSGALSYSQNAQPDVLSVVSKPADGGYVNSVDSPVFKVQAVLPDGVTPAAGVSVILSSAKATFAACSGASTCTLTTDGSGSVSSAVTPTAAGTVTLGAVAEAASATSSFVALAIPVDGLSVLSMPSGTVYATLPATAPFRVKVTLPDGTTPAAGVSVMMTATNATLGCSGGASCSITADALGTISTTVKPLAAGLVSLLASAGGGTVSASFGATALPADVLHVVSKPGDGSYGGRAAALPFAVQVMLGDNATPASGVNVTITATNATLGCGASTCTVVANAAGGASTGVTPATAGPVTLTASAGGGTVAANFSAVNVPPDILQVVTAPADNTYTGTPAALAFSVAVLLGDAVTPASGVPVVVTATGATLGACGLSTCTVTATALGTVSTAVTATSAGTVALTATAGGGSVSASFAAINSPNLVQVLSAPSDSSFVNQVAATPFVVQVLFNVVPNAHGIHALAVGRTPVVGAPVAVSAVGATLGACGMPACVLTTDSTGNASTTVTPTAAGPVTLVAASGGGIANSSFNAVTPPDVVRVTSTPANGSYLNRTAATPFAAQVVLGDGTTPAAGASVTLTATAATLNTCGMATCVVTADSAGMVSTMVTPTSVGTVTLMASAGGGTATSNFTSAPIPPDALHVVSQPANGSYAGRVASAAFTVQALLGDTGGPAAGASVTVTATNAALVACGMASCVLTADANGNVSTAVTPTSVGTATLSASTGGGTVSTSFISAAVPPDTLRVVTQPANGAYAQRTAALPFTVQVLLGDTGGAAPGVSVTVSAVNATLAVCGLSTCVLVADSTGTVSTSVMPTAVGTVNLSAAAGGGVVMASFTAVAVPPDSLHVLSQPANGSYVLRQATAPLIVQTLLGDTGSAASGVPVTLSAVNATLAACGGSSCVLIADASGNVSTMVTPLAAGVVTLTATAGGGSVTSTFTAANVPPDVLNILSQPANGSYVARVATIPLQVQTLLGDTGAPAGGASVTLTASGAALGACGTSTCVLTADSNGNVSTTVTPTVSGAVQLTATAGGGVSTVTFISAVVPPDALQVVSQPVNGTYVNVTASTPYTVQVLLGDTGAPASGVSVTVTATNAILGACGQATCVILADGSGDSSTSVTPTSIGPINITATAGGGTVTVVFNAASAPPDVLHVLSQPSGNVYAGLAASAPFSVQIFHSDGTTPAAGVQVILSAANAALGICAGGSSCALTANGSGTVSTTVTPQVPGSVTLHASAGSGSVSASFNVLALPPDILSVVSSPGTPAYLGAAAPVRFAVHVLLGDGSTVSAGIAVTLTSLGASLGACAAVPCVLTTDASGNISTPVTPLGAGTITLTASAGGGTVSASFVAVADVLRIVTAPANGSYTGSVTTVPFVVQVLLGDGSNPSPGAAVVVDAINASLGACAAMPCTLIADSQGTISTTVVANAAGIVTLTAASAGGTVSAAFTAAAPPDILEVQSAPANGSYVGRSAATPFAIRIALGNALNQLAAGTGTVLPPAVGANVTLTATGATLDACGLPMCSLIADAMGLVTSTVTPTSIGVVSLSASAAGVTISASFIAASAPDVLRVVSVPANASYSGRITLTPFAVRILSADGVTPAAGTSVVLAALGATLGACGLATCTLTADASGLVSSNVTPTSPGLISLSAAGGNSTTFASFTSSTAPDTLRVISAPATGAYAGRAAGSLFSVQVLLGDAITPASGAVVQLNVINATLGVCGLASCSVTSDANGMASSAVTPTSGGTVTLTATAGGGTITASFAAANPERTILISRATEHVAADSTVFWSPSVIVFENGAPISGVNVVWNASAPGLRLSAQSSTSDANGIAAVVATIGPLASGGSTAGQACAWTNVCVSFGAQASDADLWRLAVVSGDGQIVGANDTLQPLVVSALDEAGDSLAGVTVQVHQTIRGWVTCPAMGRCPTGPLLSMASSTVVSDANGQAVISPLQGSGSAEMTEIVAAAGSYGYVSAGLEKTP